MQDDLQEVQSDDTDEQQDERGYLGVGEDTNILSYTDALSISDYAFPAMQWACGAGVMQGTDGSLLPRDTCTRAQIVTLLFRALAEK